MKTSVFLFFLLLCSSGAAGQQGLQQEQAQLNRKGMLVLGSWSLAHAAWSGFSLPGPERSFHQMNLGWSAVNLGLAVPFYLRARQQAGNGSRPVKNYQRIFLVNTFLDLGYIGAGLWMFNNRATDAIRADRLRGFGSAMVLQGSFLFLFDLEMFRRHRQLVRQGL